MSASITVLTVTVWDYMRDQSGVPLPGKKVRVSLSQAATTIDPDPVVNVQAQPIVATTDVNGYWSVDLVPNNRLSPAGTYYAVSEEGYQSYDIGVSDLLVPDGGWQASRIRGLIVPQGDGFDLLASKMYAPNPAVTYTATSDSVFVPIDPVNLGQSFVAPSSGTVVGEALAPGAQSSGCFLAWGLDGVLVPGSVAPAGSVVAPVKVSGLTPGSTHTLTLVFAARVGQAPQSLTVGGVDDTDTSNTFGPVVLTVESAP